VRVADDAAGVNPVGERGGAPHRLDGMKYLTYADQSVLIGDEAADTLLRFSALLAEKGHADAVSLNAIGNDGDAMVTSFVLGSGTNLMSASTSSTLPEPDNRAGLDYMNEKIALLVAPPAAQPTDEEWNAAESFDSNL
jgi:hypothetical protein